MNLPSDAAFATSFTRSNSLRRLTGSTTSIRASPAFAAASNRPATVWQNPLFTSARIAAAITSKVVYPGSSHRARTSSSSATLIRSAGSSLACTALRIASSAIFRTPAPS